MSRRPTCSGGVKPSPQHCRKHDRRVNKGLRDGSVNLDWRDPLGSSQGRGHKGQASRTPHRHSVQGNSEAVCDPLMLNVPTSRRTGFQRHPRDLSRDLFLRELFSTQAPFAQVSVETAKEREVAEALYSLANLFHAANNEGLEDGHPSKPMSPSHSPGAQGSELSQRFDGIYKSRKPLPRHKRSKPQVCNVKLASEQYMQLSAGSESDMADSDGASASGQNPMGDAGMNRCQGHAWQGDVHQLTGMGQGGAPEGCNGQYAGRLLENGESAGNPQVNTVDNDLLLTLKSRGAQPVFGEGAAVVPRAKRTRTANQIASSGEAVKPDTIQKQESTMREETEDVNHTKVLSQQQPSLQTFMNVCQGGHKQSLTGSILSCSGTAKAESFPQISVLNAGRGGCGGSATGELSPSLLPVPLSMDLHGMLQVGPNIGRHGPVSYSLSPPNIGGDEAVPVPASLRKGFARNSAHVYIAQFIRWHKSQLRQEERSPSTKPTCDSSSFCAITPEEGIQPSQPQLKTIDAQHNAKQPGQASTAAHPQVLFTPLVQSSAVEVSTSQMASQATAKELVSVPVSSAKLVNSQCSHNALPPCFPLPACFHGNLSVPSIPSTCQSGLLAGGNILAQLASLTNVNGNANASGNAEYNTTTKAEANAGFNGTVNSLLSPMQAQNVRPVLAGMSDILAGDASRSNLLRTEMIRQLLMSMRGIHSTEAIAWLQCLATGCAPDGKPALLNHAPPRGVLHNQLTPDGFK